MIGSVVDVVSPEHPGVELYRTLRRSAEHRGRGVFVAEGNKVALRLLASDLEVISILLTDTWLQRCRHDLEHRPEQVTVFRSSETIVKSIVGFNYHQGIMAVGRVPPASTVESVCSEIPAPRLFVALDHLSNTENTGVIVRNCAACGVQAMVIGETSTDPYLRRSVRNSMGAVFGMPFIYSDNLAAMVSNLRERYGFSIVAAHLGSQSVSLHAVDLARDCCIVMGNEQSGVSDAVIAESTSVMAIPMAGGVDSFNVGCASAIILHEAFCRRKGLKAANRQGMKPPGPREV